MAVEAVEASEVVEADDVNEAAEVSKGSKSLLKTSESSSSLNLAYFEKRRFFGRIMKYRVEF